MKKPVSQIGVTRYALFGEELAGEDPEFIHIEDIRTRSRLYEWRITPHVHQRMLQIVFVAEGTVQVHLEDRTQSLEGPCAITIPGGAVHSFTFSEGTVGYVVTAADTIAMDARFRRARRFFEALMKEPHILDFSDAPDDADFIHTSLMQMAREFSQTLQGRSSMLDWLLRVVMMAVARRAETEAASTGARGYAHETFARFTGLVEDHYREHWPVGDYARALAMSPARLNRLCQSFAGKPTQDIIHARVALEARRLLTYTNATSAMVAYELGFQDPAYFTRFFRKRTGKTPSQFRSAPIETG